ncbi:endothelin-converting enzyme 1-like [Brachionus plicatilis]|uniref:Endothelin-converting enzyme 1-like n=1 Tax=Brachionus plicatilis TaxID=10195 RepID=A0A3M7SYF1_BRAPC|nr:endothelin-converting enzyme 1-like [Brachionus plicatilis]
MILSYLLEKKLTLNYLRMEMTKNVSTDIILRSSQSNNDYDPQVAMLNNQKNQNAKKSSKLYKKLIVLSTIICIVLLTLLVHTFYNLAQTKAKLDKIVGKQDIANRQLPNSRFFASIESKAECKTTACYKAANFMLNNLNQSIKPCENFYQFACGTWLDERPEEKDHFTMAYEKMLKDLSDLVKKQIEHTDSGIKKSLKIYYQSCTNELRIEEQSDKEFLDFMATKIGTWPLVNAKNQTSEYSTDSLFSMEDRLATLTLLRVPIFFRFLSDDFNHTKILMKILFPEDYCRLQRFFPNTTIAKIHVIQYFHEKSDFKLSEEDFGKQIDEMLELAHKVYFIRSDMYRCGVRSPRTTLVKTVSEIDSFINSNETLFNFKSFVSLLNRKTSTKLDLNTQVVVSSQALAYLKDLFSSMKSLDYPKLKFQRAFSNLIYFHTLYSLIKPSGLFSTPHINLLLPIRYYHSFFEYDKHVTRINPVDNFEMIYKIDREQSCAFSMLYVFSIPDTDEQRELQSLFLTRKFDKMIKNHTYLMLRKLINTTIDVVWKQKWIDDDTKNTVMQNLGRMEHKMVFSDNIFDKKRNNRLEMNYNLTFSYVINKLVLNEFSYSKEFDLVGVEQTSRLRNKQYMIDIFEANLMYFKEHNTLLMPAGVLIEPIFSINNPIYLNYATIGSFLAHELFHLIDEELFRAKQETRAFYIEKLECLRKNYVKYVKMNYGYEIEAGESISEQISDTFGVLVSFKTFLEESAQKAYMSDVMLPGIGHSPEQLFFMRYAQSYCRKRQLNSVHQFEQFHVIHEFRSLQVSLIPEFTDVFKCNTNVFYNLTQLILGQKNPYLD